MGKSRIEAFSDGVIAIMVLELKVPHGASFNDLVELTPIFLSYLLSFVYVGIYWNKLYAGYYPHYWPRFGNGGIGCRQYCGRKFSAVVLGLTLYGILSCASAGTGREDGDRAFRRGDYQDAAIAWFGGASGGDSEQQELLADLLLGPHARAVRHGQYDAIQYLYRAAIGGRQSAMLTLSALLRIGSSGAKQDAGAARCWAASPTGSHDIQACVAATAFQSKRARVPCSAFALSERNITRSGDVGAETAKLCLANKTPALLVPGLPPSARDMQRVTEYARHGIEWAITGDVYNGEFERFREFQQHDCPGD